jgi:DHA1 family bicyclomycin/chloramphenicol resistance-like MFS transporter
MAISMDLTPFQVAILFAARQISAGITQLPAGLIGDNFKKRGMFLLSTFWWVSISQLIASGITNYWFIVGFLTIASAAAAAWHPVAMGAMTQWMPNRKGFVLAIHMLGGSIVEVLVPLLVGFLLVYLDWDLVLQINTIPTIILGLIFIKLSPLVVASTKKNGSGLNIRGFTRSIMKPGALAILLMVILHNMSLVAFMSMAPLYFQEIRGFSSDLIGITLSLFLIGGAVTLPFIGHISDKIDKKNMAIWGLIGGGISAWCLTLLSSYITIFPVLIVSGLFMLSIRPVIMAMALEKIGHRESTALGLISSLGEGFAALGAILAGIFGDIDLSFSLILAAILSILAGLVVIPVNHKS